MRCMVRRRLSCGAGVGGRCCRHRAERHLRRHVLRPHALQGARHTWSILCCPYLVGSDQALFPRSDPLRSSAQDADDLGADLSIIALAWVGERAILVSGALHAKGKEALVRDCITGMPCSP